MKRRIVQIAAIRDPNPQAYAQLFAVADDGTLWTMDAHDWTDGWVQVVALPAGPDIQDPRDYEVPS
jgi:hypothetical protein